MKRKYKGKNWKLYNDDCISRMDKMKENSFDSCVTDPPYSLQSIVKRFGGKSSATAKHGKDGSFTRLSKGFMGKIWDNDIAFDVKTWEKIYRILKPGAQLLAFGSARTQHRMVTALEDAGFIIKGQVYWFYGCAMAVGQDLPKAIDKQLGAKRKVIGSINHTGYSKIEAKQGAQTRNVLKSKVYDEHPITKQAKKWVGWNTVLKTAVEPIVWAQKPFSEKTTALNVLKWGTGGINIDACRVKLKKVGEDKRLRGKGSFKTDKMAKNVYAGGFKGNKVKSSEKGRHPATLMHDGSQAVLAEFAKYGNKKAGGKVTGREPSTTGQNGIYRHYNRVANIIYNDEGSAARFFYSSKASKLDRALSGHPTVKPQDLMRYLCRLVTQPGGRVLEPFAGSGSTLQAALEEGFKVTGIEKEPEYVKNIIQRMKLYHQGHLKDIKTFKAYQAKLEKK